MSEASSQVYARDELRLAVEHEFGADSRQYELMKAVDAEVEALKDRVIEAETMKRAMHDRATVVRIRESNGELMGEPFEVPSEWDPEAPLRAEISMIVQTIEVPEGGLLHVRVGATAQDLGTDSPWIPSEKDCEDYEDHIRSALGLPSRDMMNNLGVPDGEPKLLVTHRWVEIVPVAMPEANR